MSKSSTPLINHIPRFLAYYKDKGYSVHTQENYKRYLDKFISWLREGKKEFLLPHQFTNEDVRAYKLYLSRFQGQNGHPLKKVTQNYYLIALRAFLGYFVAKDVVSLPPGKIALPGGFRRGRTPKYLNLGQIKGLLTAPDIKKRDGLRDKTILETLVSTGLKINQLVSLDRKRLNDLPQEVLFWLFLPKTA